MTKCQHLAEFFSHFFSVSVSRYQKQEFFVPKMLCSQAKFFRSQPRIWFHLQTPPHLPPPSFSPARLALTVCVHLNLGMRIFQANK